MRTSDQAMNGELRTEIFNLLPELFADMKTSDEIKKFLQVFLSEKEFEVLSKRIAILYWLKKGKKYHDIRDQIKVSSATIASSQELIEKKELEEAFKILDANEWAGKISSKIKNLLGNGKNW